MNRLKKVKNKPIDVPHQIKVDLSTSDDVCCESCDSKYFDQAFTMKKVSPLQSPSGKMEYLAFIKFVCHNCGKELEPDVAIKILA